jgi:hypothetical protein
LDGGERVNFTVDDCEFAMFQFDSKRTVFTVHIDLGENTVYVENDEFNNSIFKDQPYLELTPEFALGYLQKALNQGETK